MSERLTELHLVIDLGAALEVAHDLGAKAIGLDMEGVLGNFVGNKPYQNRYSEFLQETDDWDGCNLEIARRDIQYRQGSVNYGLVTNNTNERDDLELNGAGLVTKVAERFGIPYVHKGMLVDGSPLPGKPSGEQSKAFCEMVDVDPSEAVLIDDQGVKNAGEAVRAGLKAVIIPNPIGRLDSRGRVIEHKGVMFARRFEPAIYRSLGKRGLIAQVAYSRIANVPVDRIGTFVDHR